MSYILEALNKSQRERELGRVPTLADAPYLSADRPKRGAYWGIVALVLALCAMLVALYGTFGKAWLSGQDPAPTQMQIAPQNPPDPKPAVPDPEPAGDTPSVIAANDTPRPPKPQNERPEPAPAATSQNAEQPERRPKPAKPPVIRSRPVAPPAPAVATVPPVPMRHEPIDTPKVPSDLVQDIRRFEEKLRQEKAVEPPEEELVVEEPEPVDINPEEPPEPDTESPEPAPAEEPIAGTPAPPEPRPARVTLPRPTDLPVGLQQSIAELRLTVHVYSDTPKQRFVIIDSRKLREGERSRKGLLVEEITPDGVRLEHQGQRFFYPR